MIYNVCMSSALRRKDLETFLAVVDAGSVQGAARRTGLSRTTIQRRLAELEQALGAPPLFERRPGRRRQLLTAEGHEVARRARILLEHWRRSTTALRDAVARPGRVRVGTLAGSFDLLVDLFAGGVGGPEGAELRYTVRELPEDRLLSALAAGEVDLAFGTRRSETPAHLRFERLGSLGWAAIVPVGWVARFPPVLDVDDLADIPLVVLTSGPARAHVDRWFASAPGGPVVPAYAFETGSTPRLVEMVARGLGVGLVSRFRLSFLTERVAVRPLRTEPAPLVAGIYRRAGAPPSPAIRRLVQAARRRFVALADEGDAGAPAACRSDASR